jgi:hypothetical protein
MKYLTGALTSVSSALRGIIGKKTNSNTELESLTKTSAEVVSYTTKSFHSFLKAGTQIIAGVHVFEYLAGKIISTKAMGGLVPNALTVGSAAKVTNLLFKGLVKYPTEMLVGTVATLFVIHPEELANLVTNSTMTIKSICQTGFHATKLGLALTTEAIEGTCSYLETNADNSEKPVENKIDDNNDWALISFDTNVEYVQIVGE